MKYLALTLILFLTSCSTDRQLYDFDELDLSHQTPNLHNERSSKIAPKPKLPQIWRGRKLFTSPWAYIYAKNKEAASYAYDELAKQVENTDKAKSYGIIIVTGSEDLEKAFTYQEIIKLYKDHLKSAELLEGERPIFEEDLKKLNKIQSFHIKVQKAADKKKDENELKKFRKSVDRLISIATFFIQPEIMQEYMKNPIDDSIYWCAFISVDDTIDENMDGMVSALLEDYEVSTIGKGLIWGLVSPWMYFSKKKIIKKSQETFADGYKKNALLNEGIVKFSDKAVKSQPPETVNGSE